MKRWPILALVCFGLCGCQAGRIGASMSNLDCPSPNPCDDPDSEALLGTGPTTIKVAYRPLKPGCPSTLQVMARLHPVAFQATRPRTAPEESDPDQYESVCAPPDAPLLRAGPWHLGRTLATR
jgi:hypothetical protein